MFYVGLEYSWDENGTVSSKEWGKGLAKNKDLMAKYFGGSTMKEIGEAFRRIDANSDKQLTWEEFTAAAQKLIGSAAS